MKYSFGVSRTWELGEHELECAINGKDLDLPTQNLIIPFCNKQYIRHAVVNAGPKEMGKLAEKIAEIKYVLGVVDSSEYDYNMEDFRLEVKSSRAFIKGKRRKMVKSIDLPFSDLYNCNIQQIKRELFDSLMYMIFSHDKVQVFMIRSDDIDGAGFGYSNKQHRNNDGEGQFHIHSGNYSLHLPLLIDELGYDECYELLMSDKEAARLVSSFH